MKEGDRVVRKSNKNQPGTVWMVSQFPGEVWIAWDHRPGEKSIEMLDKLRLDETHTQTPEG